MESTKFKRIAYLAPELPSLSATFVTNEIWALEKIGAEIHPYSIHVPGTKAYGDKAEALAQRTEIIYNKSIGANLKALLWNMIHHKRSTLKAFGMLIGDMIKTGGVSKTALKLKYQFIKSGWMAMDMRKKNIEHLHIHFAHVPTQVAMYGCTLAGIPFTFQTHANDIFERPLLIKEKVNRSKKAVSISNFNIDLMEIKGADRTKISIVRCGVDSTIEAKHPSSVMNDTPVIGTLGRLVEKKGVDTLISAAGLIKKQGINIRIEIAGDGPLLEKLKAQVDLDRLGDIVKFKGSLPHSAALEWMNGLDIFVLACKQDKNGDMDGIPVVLMEAMNVGIPVISTMISGIPELVIDGSTGLTCDPGNADQLSENILKLLNDRELRRSLTNNAKQHIIDEFDIGVNAHRLLNIIQN